MSYEVTWEANGLYRKFVGKISGMEILESNFKLQLNSNFKDLKYIINDFSEVTSHSVKSAHTVTYAQTDDIISKVVGELKIAIIANNDSILELANSYRKEMKNELFECEIFKNIEDAQNWTRNN